MNRIISLIIILSCLVLLSSCSAKASSSAKYEQQQFDVVYFKPENALTPAPQKDVENWDVKSVRDPYVAVEKTDYSMPVYLFDTYESYLHLVDLIGTENTLVIEPTFDDYEGLVEYYDYRGGTFESYSLILGWFTVETHHSLNCYLGDIEYTQGENGLTVSVNLAKTCTCSPNAKVQTLSGLVWISVEKDQLDSLESISIVLKDCFVAE